MSERDRSLPGLEPGLLRRVGELLAEHAGLRPPGWVLEARLGRRIAALEMGGGDRYADLLESADGAPELDLLVESLRVGETRFFRHRAHVQAVTEVVIPALAARGRGRVRAWSAGCASGEEPYTLAILLARGLPAPTFQVSVLATDISKEALETARAATYPAAALEQVPDPVRAAFAPAEGGRMRVVPAAPRWSTSPSTTWPTRTIRASSTWSGAGTCSSTSRPRRAARW